MTAQELMQKRRSINFFDPEREVDDALLKKIIETAALTPSGFNAQPWNLFVVKERADRERLLPLAKKQPKIMDASVVLMVLADRDAWKGGNPSMELNWQSKLNDGSMTAEKREWFLNVLAGLYGKNSETALAFAVKNAAFFAMSLMLAATGEGLETHPMDGFDHDAVRKEFRIPENFWIPLLLAVGYRKPGLKLNPAKWRKSYDDIVLTF